MTMKQRFQKAKKEYWQAREKGNPEEIRVAWRALQIAWGNYQSIKKTSK